MISSIEEVTPALVGIKENLTEEAVIKHWSLCIQPILNHEEDLFIICQDCMPLTRKYYLDRSKAYEVFLPMVNRWMLNHEYHIDKPKYELSSDEKAIATTRDRCLLGTFSQYRQIYNVLPYEDMNFESLMEFWREKYKNHISATWSDLMFWKSGKALVTSL